MKTLCITLILAFAPAAMSQTASQTTTTTTAAPTMSDAQIAEVLLTINEGEIDAAKLARRKAGNAQVKDFAKMMVDEHQKNEKETKALTKKHKIDHKDSDMSEALEEQAKTAHKDLKKTDKAAFDKAYLSQQVLMHEKALATIRNTLLPQAQNPELKAHLEKTQQAVSMHLDHAKKLQSQIQ